MDVKHFGMKLWQLGANTLACIYESFPVGYQMGAQIEWTLHCPLQRRQGTSECGNPSKFNILDQDQTDPDIWHESVSLTRMSGDENRRGIFMSTSDPLISPFWFRKLTWVSWLWQSIKTGVPAPKLSCDILFFFGEFTASVGWEIAVIVTTFWCISVDCELLYLHTNIAKLVHLRNGSACDMGCHFNHVPKVSFFSPHAHLYSFPFWYFPQILFNQIPLLMWTLLKAFHLPISQLLPS